MNNIIELGVAIFLERRDYRNEETINIVVDYAKPKFIKLMKEKYPNKEFIMFDYDVFFEPFQLPRVTYCSFKMKYIEEYIYKVSCKVEIYN